MAEKTARPGIGERTKLARRKFTLSEPSFAFLLNSPPLILILLLVIGPVIYSFWLSLHKYNLRRPQVFDFVGLRNYIDILESPQFWQAMRVTAIFAFFSVCGILILSLILALVLNEPFKGRGILRSLVLLPWAIPGVANGLMWQWIFDSRLGAFNGLLYSLGLIDSYRPWLIQPTTALAALIFAQIWNCMPFSVIVLLAGLQAIPLDLYDAAKVDRANAFKRFRHITLPWLLHPILIVAIVQTMNALRSFALVYILTGGGPGNSTTVIYWLTYATTFHYLDFGKGNAYAYLVTLFTLGLATLYIWGLYGRGEIEV